ncbi:MAG: ATP-binding protein [Holophaga sp.]|jgi:signal transduction histidine kinase
MAVDVVPDSQQLMAAFAAFTQASEQLQQRYESLQGQLGRLQNEIQTVLEAVPFAIWVLGGEGELRFTNRPEGLPGQFMDGPPPWEPGAPEGLRPFLDPAGRERFLEQENRPTEAGQIIILRDVTEAHLRAQQANREQRLQAMGLMAAELAHEIRNPLGSLSLFAGMLVQDLQSLPAQVELAQHIQASVQRLNTLVTNTLTFSRDISPKPTVFPLAEFWEGARAGCNLPEEVAWENRVPAVAAWCADPDLLRQVAVNLLQNAVRSLEGRPAPKLTVSAMPETVEGRPHWQATLEDNGCGIAPEALSRIFDPFYTTFGGGTGLGLAVSHRILMAHKGLINIESRPEHGTQVHLRLPAREPADRKG